MTYRGGGPATVERIDAPRAAPCYELRVLPLGTARSNYEVWQLPAPATPQITRPTRIAGLMGRNLELVEHRVLKRLTKAGFRLTRPAGHVRQGFTLTEDLALHLGLLFRALAPMRNRDRMRAVAEGIERMDREEAAYWLGMAMHRQRPRRVLAALRLLLTEPGR